MRTLLLGSAITIFSASFALAADLGQYRPGNPYQSVIAPGADVCESHCAGDAQCRSWNYIKANPQAAGVCEFNSNDAAPVASAISISGTNAASSFRSGVVSGGTNTIRVGTQTATKPRAVTERTSSNRRIVREPVPQQRQAQTASTRPVIRPTQPGSLTEQQNQYRQPVTAQRQAHQPTVQPPQAAIPQQFKYDLGGQAIRAPQAPQRAVPPQARPYPNHAYAPQAPQIQRPQVQGQPQVQPQRQQMTSRDRRRQQGPSIQQRQQMPQAMSSNAIGQAYPPQAPMTTTRQQAYAPQQQQMMRRSATQPLTHQNANSAYATQQAPAQLARGISADQAQQSLFGKLNDDVIVPNSAASVPSDPNAPIPTSASRPVTPVQQSPLEGLAGAPKP